MDAIMATGVPAADLRSGGDHHIAFARSHAQLYLLLLRPGSEASESSLAKLRTGFEHLADQGALREGITAAQATILL